MRVPAVDSEMAVFPAQNAAADRGLVLFVSAGGAVLSGTLPFWSPGPGVVDVLFHAGVPVIRLLLLLLLLLLL